MIGEHIDYEGYSVLPMAIRQDTIIAIRKHDNEEDSPKLLRIANVNDKYDGCTYPADPDQVRLISSIIVLVLLFFILISIWFAFLFWFHLCLLR